MSRRAHPIEIESYAILRSRIDLSARPPLCRAVTERVIHASADVGYADDLVCTEQALSAGHEALHAGAPLVVDSRMLAAGVTSRGVAEFLSDPRTAHRASAGETTRAAAAMRLASEETGPGAVWAIGNAPTALAELLRLDVEPALIVSLPVGFVGAVEAKAALCASGLRALTNRSEKGGAPVAAAAVNALLYHRAEDE